MSTVSSEQSCRLQARLQLFPLSQPMDGQAHRNGGREVGDHGLGVTNSRAGHFC
jgi:hypothetical protein